MPALSISFVSPHMRTTARLTVWWAVLSVGVLSGCFAAYVRFSVVCPRFDLSGFEFMPLASLVGGSLPHFFFRLMHNLTHPVLLVAYMAALVFLTVKIIANRPIPKQVEVRREVAAIFILVLLCAYFGSLFLPIGDLVVFIHNP